MQPLVTIITPTYKQNKYDEFHKMIQSVNTQTYTNWEHIICSDGIYEKHIEKIVENYNNPRRKYIVSSQHFGGFGAAVRQECMDNHAKGQYFVFLDDDNYIFPDYLEKMIGCLMSNPETKFCICKILHFGPVRVDLLGNPPLYLAGIPKTCYIDTLQVMVEKNAMLETGWVNKSHYCSDGFTFESLFLKYPNYCRVDQCLAVHT